MILREYQVHKFESTGNDFILMDDRNGAFDLTEEEIRKLCHRKFGLGADGLILLQHAADCDFGMRYYNSDGRKGTFCGNGGRAITAFAKMQGISDSGYRFRASDGLHQATITTFENHQWQVELEMKDTLVDHPELIDTGSPHHVVEVENIEAVDLEIEGPALRNHYRFGSAGCNVNFSQFKEGKLHVRTFERGVEAETLSCGTGVTASAIYHHSNSEDGVYQMEILTPGGALQVRFEKLGNLYTGITLSGPTRHLFTGKYYL
jgi:diaminopimelate epimerase